MILLFSGGIDSYVAWHYLKYPKTVYFDLKTPYSEREKQVVKYLIPSTVIDESLDLGKWQRGAKAYIPFRNLYLAMLAYNHYDFNEANHLGEPVKIVIAGIMDDVVSDKNEPIFAEFSKIMSLMEDDKIKVTSPFWRMTKSDIVTWFLNEHPDKRNELILTISCYAQDEASNYCGRCPSCFRKWCALWDNKIYLGYFDMGLMHRYYTAAKQGTWYIPERNASIIRCVEDFRSGDSKDILRGGSQTQKT